MTIDTLMQQGQQLWDQAVAIWIAGGWGMLAIAVDALVMFAMGAHIYFRLWEKGFLSVREKTWRQWLDEPSKRRGPIGDLLTAVSGGKTVSDTALLCQGVRTTEIAPFERDLRVMKICIGTAPLLGLFGTVTGMLATFGALASGSGGEKTMGLIAEGIAEALITTETGLVIALPGLFFHYQLARKFDRYKAFLAHVEAVCTQNVYRQIHARGTAA